jgi:catechol 2,3-dioxygenase-like lactoylglutathione lyase family enzyme
MIHPIAKELAEYKGKTRNLWNHSNPIIRVAKISHLTFLRKDLPESISFMEDFGLICNISNDREAIFAAQSSAFVLRLIRGGEDKLVSIGFLAASREDLHTLGAKTGRTPAQSDIPFAHEKVLLTDPDGVGVEVIYYDSQVNAATRQSGTERAYNFNSARARTNAPIRITPDESAPILKLGHTVIATRDNRLTIQWYQKHLGLITSDFQFLPGDYNPVATFLRCDCGGNPTDHHSLAIVDSIETGHVHSAFEVADIDDLMQTSLRLQRRGRKHSWGVGRHYLGSQIFNYWRDLSGAMFELYTDGDMFDNTIEPGYYWFGRDAQAQWGPPVTADFLDSDVTLGKVTGVVKRIFSADQMTIGRITGLLKSISGE